MSRQAITRAVSRTLESCELTHLSRQKIDVGLAREQHRAYADQLRAAGVAVRELAEQPELADSVFVEDNVVVLDEVAILMWPGAASRQPEVESMAEALAPLRKVLRVRAPGTLDGGDVLRLERKLCVGGSSRSNGEGVRQLAELTAPFGYVVEAVPLHGCLHLKSAVTRVGKDLLLVNPDWVDTAQFAGWRILTVDPSEPFGANSVWLGDRVIYSASFLRTAAKLRDAGIDVREVEMSETEKAEGGVTCCSVIFDA